MEQKDNKKGLWVQLQEKYKTIEFRKLEDIYPLEKIVEKQNKNEKDTTKTQSDEKDSSTSQTESNNT